jgi:hypothetical protein
MSEERNRPRGGWLRAGSKGRFRYLDRNRRRIGDEERITRIESLAIPPAWTDVWISPRPYAKLQATGYDKAGRKQYLYHPDYRAAQEEAKYDGLIRFGGRLPELRAAMTEHLDKDELDRERVSAIALRVISLGWFRVGSERYAREGTYGVTTLLRRQVHVRGRRIRLSFPSKAGIRVRSELVDKDLADEIRGLLQVRGWPAGLQVPLGGRPLQPHEQTAERLREDLARGGIQRQGLPDGGRHAPRRDLLCGRYGPAGISAIGTGAEAIDHVCHAACREATRKYACRDARVLCLACGCRAVPRGTNDRRFPAPPFAGGQGTGCRAVARRAGDAQSASFLAYQARTRRRIVALEFL